MDRLNTNMKILNMLQNHLHHHVIQHISSNGFNNLPSEQYMHRREETWNRHVHNALQRDLVEHVLENCQEWYDDV